MNREFRRKIKTAKEECIEEQCKSTENDVRNNTLKALAKSQHKSAVIEDSSGNILTESTAVLNQWTEYCSDLYNYKLHPDTNLLQSNQPHTQEAESLPVLKEDVEEAVRNPKAGKSPGVDNIPSDLFKNGGETTPTVLTVICQTIRETKEWTKEWTQSLVIPLPQKCHPKQCKNYRTISHPIKIMFRVRLKAKA